MNIVAGLVVWAIALLHVYILILEMFLWTTPRGRKAFGLTPEFARQTKALAANQGLYNGFLAAGLVWGLLHPDFMVGVQIQLFFLVCIAVAGVYGAITAKLSILFIQTLPAIIAIGLLGAATYFNVAQVAPT
jgi:putative membrane protein